MTVAATGEGEGAPLQGCLSWRGGSLQSDDVTSLTPLKYT